MGAQEKSRMRIKDVSIDKPIIWGSVSRPLTQKRPDLEAHTHEWVVYVKGLEDEDLSRFVRKVVFKLHDSFESPNRGACAF